MQNSDCQENYKNYLSIKLIYFISIDLILPLAYRETRGRLLGLFVGGEAEEKE